MRRNISLGLAILWMALVVALYYWVHKPINAALVEATGGALIDILSAFLITLVAGGVGKTILTRIFGEKWTLTLSHPEALAGEALFGYGVVSVCIFGVGLVNLSFASIVLLLVVLAVVSIRSLAKWLADLVGWFRQIELTNLWEKGLGWFIGLNLLMAIIMAVAPPTKFDTLTYHLLGAKLWDIDGRFHALPESHFFGFPQAVNTLYAGQMALLFGRYTGAAALHWMVGSLTLLAIGGYTARRFNRFTGFLAPAILLTATSIWLQFTWAYLDLFTTACGILTFIMLDEWHRAEDESDKTRWLAMAGVFVGLAMSAKYNSAILAITAGVYVLIFGWKKYKFMVLRPAILITLVALVVFLPWLLRNAVFYGNPVYPMIGDGGEWDNLKAEFYTDADNAPLKTHPEFIIPIFISSTILGVEGGGLFTSTIGPLFLLLIPMLLLCWKNLDENWRISLRGLLLLVVVMHLVWIGTTAFSEVASITRFVFPMFPWMAILAAVALEGLKTLPRKPLDFAWVMRAVTVLVLVFTFIPHVAGKRPDADTEGIGATTLTDHFIATRSLEYFFGVLSKEDYLEDRLGWYIVAMNAVNDLPDDSKVLFLWETRSLYCDEPRITCEEDEILFNYWHARRTIGDVDTILNQWREDGITDILVWETGRDFEFEDNKFFTQDDITEWDHLASMLTVEWQGDTEYTLYSLSATSPIDE